MRTDTVTQSTIDKSTHSEFHQPVCRVQYAYTAATSTIRLLTDDEIEQLGQQVFKLYSYLSVLMLLQRTAAANTAAAAVINVIYIATTQTLAVKSGTAALPQTAACTVALTLLPCSECCSRTAMPIIQALTVLLVRKSYHRLSGAISETHVRMPTSNHAQGGAPKLVVASPNVRTFKSTQSVSCTRRDNLVRASVHAAFWHSCKACSLHHM
jgi:hypothetical protein